MSQKHVKEQYEIVKEQYLMLLNELKDFTKEAEEGIVDPDTLENVKLLLEPLKQNYERWTYMMHLLYKPNRDKKRSIYERQTSKVIGSLSPCNSIEAMQNENKNALKEIRNRYE